jgi:predicted anti-sigma-YlaC factor YlaD
VTAVQETVRARKCARARRAHSLLLDGVAGCDDVVALATHLDECESCRRHVRQVSQATYLLRSLRLDPFDDRRHVRSTKGARS